MNVRMRKGLKIVKGHKRNVVTGGFLIFAKGKICSKREDVLVKKIFLAT